MSKGGRKGRVSNELVAASCAAILVVYAAGYWRTREEARRFETQAQVRRPVRTAPAVPVMPAAPDVPPAPAVPLIAAAPVVAPLVASDSWPVEEITPGVGKAPAPASSAGSGKHVEPTTTAVAEAPPSERLADAPAAAPDPLPSSEVAWRDGTYTAWGLSYHGDIEARVIIKDGRIRTSEIATCATRYPCYVIDSIIQQPVDRQSAEVDRVSRATESADAYRDAVWGALQKAEADPAATPVTSP